jgi:hypothetical protein
MSVAISIPCHLRTFWLISVIICRTCEYTRAENLEEIKPRRRENRYALRKIIKRQTFPVTGRGGPWHCETSRLPHFLDNRLIEGVLFLICFKTIA